VRLPLFPVTVIGSWPRPRWLLEALRARREGRITDEEFQAIADEAVLLAVKYQEDAGVNILTDGEQRRDNFYSFIVDKIEGVTLRSVAEIIDLIPDKARFEYMLRSRDVPAYSIRNPIVVSRLKLRDTRRGIVRDEVRFLREHTRNLIKATLPGPYLLTRASWVPAITKDYYPTREDLGFEFAKLIRSEIEALRDLGVYIVQLDEPVLTEVVYGDVTEQTFMCAALFTKQNPRDELEFAVQLINEAVRGVSGIKVGVHVCRGNWTRSEEALLKGDYWPLAPFFAEMKVDHFALEFATPRAGDVDVVKEFLGDREIGFGVVNPRTDDVEDPRDIVSRVEKLLKYVDPSKVYLNPDCGFGTFAETPVNTPRIAYRKLRSLRIAAEELRRRYGGS